VSAVPNIRPEAVISTIVVLVDPEVERLERRLAFAVDIYRRRVWPTLIASASILGAVVIIAQVVKWIAR